MMTTSRRITLEQCLFSLAFLLALLLRFLHLGSMPLTDLEAKWAMQALEIARGSNPLLGGQPGYLILTAFNFFVFGGSNFLSRFWPALVGSGLVLVPIAFQKQLGVKAAIILSFALALDPGLLAISRMVGSPIMAVGFTAMCLAAWESKRIKLAGFFGGMALLSGPSAWFGALGLGITWLLVRSGTWRKQTHAITPETEEGAEEKEEGNEVGSKTSMQTSPTKTAMTWGGITMLLVGTLFFLVPDGLSAWAGSIVDFIRGWLTIFLVQPWFLLAALLMYGPLALIFVVRRLWRGQFKTDPTNKETGILAGVFLLLALIYPAHQAGDLAWMLVPLWALAALEFSDELVFISTKRWEITLASAIAFIFIVFIWLNLISIPSLFNNSTHVESSVILAVQNLFKSIGVDFNGMVISRMLIMLGAVVLLILSMLLVTTIWETKVTQLGIGWGGTIALLLYTVNAGMGAAGLRIPYSVEIWQPSPQFVQADLMLKTIDHLSDWRKGHIDSLEIFVETSANTPAVAWLLRDWKVTQVDAVTAADSPDLVILPEGYEGTLTSEYRGQDFVIKKTPIWYGLSMDDWLRWIAFREISERSENLVLWARNDLFPDPGASANTSTP